MTMTPLAAPPFPSLAAMRLAHRELVEKARQLGDGASDVLADARDFVRRGRSTGTLLDKSKDQLAAQSLLDYWATTLYREAHESPDATLAEFDPDLAPELDDAACPYPGLEPYRASDAKRFFGRQAQVDELIAGLANNRLLPIIGPSGSGKTSLIDAGVLPALRAGAIPGSENWIYRPRLKPGTDPVRSLARLLASGDPNATTVAPRDHAGPIRKDPGYLAAQLDAAGETSVLFIDRFEEVFSLCHDGEGRQAFAASLIELTNRSNHNHVVIVSMLSDFESHVAQFPELQSRLEQFEFHLPPPSAKVLREAIERPADLAGLHFDEGVIGSVVREVLGEPAAFSLLQFSLLGLWDQRYRNRITADVYRKVGAGRKALVRRAEEVFGNLSSEEQKIARRLLEELVRPGDGSQIIRARAPRRALCRAQRDPQAVDRLIGELAAARLVRLRPSVVPEEETVELAHEALLRDWPRFAEWLEERRERLTRRRRLLAKAAEWVRLGRGQGGLLDEVELLEARRWLDSPDASQFGYDVTLLDLVGASREAIEREKQEKEEARQREIDQAKALAEEQARRAELSDRASKRTKLFLAAVAVAAVVCLILAFVAFRNSTEAELQRNTATSRALAASANENVRTDPELSILLALEALNRSGTTEAENALHRAVGMSRVRMTLPHAEAVVSAAFDDDGKKVVTAAGNLVTIWDLAADPPAANELVRLPDSVTANAVTFSPDGALLAVACAEREPSDRTKMLPSRLRVFDAHSRTEVFALAGHAGALTAVAFSADGGRIATAGDDGRAIVWDAATKLQRFTVSHPGHPALTSAAFDDSGLRLATSANVEGEVSAYIWDARNGRRIHAIYHGEPLAGVKDVAFRESDFQRGEAKGRMQRLATAGEDNSTVLWDYEGNKIRTLPVFTNGVSAVDFSPDGSLLAAAIEDNTARVWDAVTGQEELFRLLGHTGWLTDINYSRDGRYIVTASLDKQVRIWDAGSNAELPSIIGKAGIVDLAYSSDGSRIVTSDENGVADIWELPGTPAALQASNTKPALKEVKHPPQKKRPLPLHVAINREGDLVATAREADPDHESQAALVWDVGSLAQSDDPVCSFDGGHSPIAFSEKESRLAFVTETSGTLQVSIWDYDSTNVDCKSELQRLDTGFTTIRALTFAAGPGGEHFLAVADGSGIVQVWDVESKTLQFKVATGINIYTIAFSSDGRWLAAAGREGTTGIWNVGDGKDKAEGDHSQFLRGHNGRIRKVAFSPAGDRLATASEDWTVKVWDPMTGTELLSLRDHTNRVYGAAFSPDGKRLATGSKDRTVRVYTLDLDVLRRISRTRVTRMLRADECAKYLQGPCPSGPK